MRTPAFTRPCRDAEGATVKLQSPPNGEFLPATEKHNIEVTPLPLQLGNGFPRVRGYELLSIVGTGGMGIVYEAHHTELQRRVAIKTLRGEALADPEFRERFRAEAAAIAKLQHPNIIQVFEVGTVEPMLGETDSTPFIALEFVDGGSLAQRTRTPQPPKDAAKMVETLARAADAAHRLGIIHRDLKPSNVLLTRDGQPKIADFGIAKQLGIEYALTDRTLTRAGIVMGTPEYMAPEQLEGNPASPAIDVYSLGVILYELLTGRVPFQGATFADTMMLTLREEPVSPRRLQPNIPRDLETICLKCLEKQPAKRYESAEALADDLARWADGRAIKARPVGPVERAARWARRNPAVAVLTLAVHLVALAGLTGIVWGWSEAQRNAINAQSNAKLAEDEAVKAREAARNERVVRYRANVFAASSALRLYDVNAARRLLDEAPEEYRDWVWHQLRAQLDRSRAAFAGNPGGIYDARFTPNGRWVVLHGSESAIRVWDVAERKDSGLIEVGHHAHSFTLSPDGAVLAYDDENHNVVLRDVNTKRQRTVLRGHTKTISRIAFSADSTRVSTSACDNTFRIWNSVTGEQLHVFNLPGRLSLSSNTSPDFRFVASLQSNSAQPIVWEAETGRERVLDGHTGNGYWLEFSPQSDRCVTVESFPTNTVRLWDTATGRLLATLRGHANQVTHIKFSTDGTRLLTTSMDRTIRVWDVSRETAGQRTTPLLTLRGHTGCVYHADFNPTGTRIVSSSHDRTIRYWDAQTGEQLAVLCGHTTEVKRAVFLPEKSMLVSICNDGVFRLWDIAELERGYAIRGHEQFVYSAAFFSDGQRIASTAWDATARVWDATSGKQLQVLDHQEDLYVTSVAVHPNGRLVATLSRPATGHSGSVRVWDLNTGRAVHHWAVPSGWQDSRVAFDPRGELLAAGSADNTVRIWDVNTGAEVAVLKGHKSPVRDVAFSPDGRWLASSGEDGDNAIRIWDTRTKQQVQSLQGHTRAVYALAWNRDGSRLASGSLDHTVRVWESSSWKLTSVLKQGTSVYGVAFTADGNQLATACQDNLIRIWDVRTQQELAELSGHTSYVHHLAFSPDGTRLISASGDWTLRVWDTVSPAERGTR